MQQTETYKLNLIEMSDTFSTAPLNENAQKTESALLAETAERQAADAALDSRVTALELHKIAVGHYTGDGAERRVIELGFTPVAVFIHGVHMQSKGISTIAVTGNDVYYGIYAVASIVPNGFVLSITHDVTYYNLPSYEYNYVALA